MNKIFLDNQSTTQVDPEVLEAMIPFFTTRYGNASSKTHAYGWEAEASIEIAREKIAKLIKSDSDEIIFTSGATEANNIALSNILQQNEYNHIITLSTEHKATLDVCNYLSKKGINITYLKPEKNGIVILEKIKNSFKKNTYMISVMHANNEIGVIQPISEIGNYCKKNKILFHVDAAQSLGKILIDVKKMNIDLLSISGHKIYGPKGVGALFINNKINNKISPILFGGNQEKSIRPGTVPVPLVIGFGKACEKANILMVKESKYLLKLRTLLLNSIKDQINDIIINGDLKSRLPGNLNITFPSLKGQSIIPSMPKIAISSGSACTSSIPKPSYVLKEIGLNNHLSNSAIRIGIGRFNTRNDIKTAAKSIIKAVKIKSSFR